jgi:hypothetical protein
MQGAFRREAVNSSQRSSLGGGETLTGIIIIRGGLMLPQGAPTGPVLDDPIEQGLFKANVVSHFFAFDPFMTENFRPLGQKFLIEG